MTSRLPPLDLFGRRRHARPGASLLKWVGNKYRMAEEISSYFPPDIQTYREVFLGGGSVLATVAPANGVGSDSFGPLIDIWQAVKSNPDTVKQWYTVRWHELMSGDKRDRYEAIKASYNAKANAADFLFLTRACYAGVVRFRKRDGYMSTPVGAHDPISPESFCDRVDDWHDRVQGTEFRRADYVDAMEMAEPGDLIYCDPPYAHSQAILYGAQDFDLTLLFQVVLRCKDRGVRVAMSIDGSAKSGQQDYDIVLPDGLFLREVPIDVGRSMLRRLQMNGQTLESEGVMDRLLLTY